MARLTKAQKAAKEAEAAAAAAGTSYTPPAQAAAPIVLTEQQGAVLFALQQTQAYIAEHCKPHIDEEKRLRGLFIASVMPTPVEGTTYIELGAGWRTRIRAGFKRMMDRAQFAAVFGQLPAGTDAQVIDWKPQLIKSGYDALPEDQRAILDQCITTKPGLPSVVVLAPGQEDAPDEE